MLDGYRAIRSAALRLRCGYNPVDHKLFPRTQLVLTRGAGSVRRHRGSRGNRNVAGAQIGSSTVAASCIEATTTALNVHVRRDGQRTCPARTCDDRDITAHTSGGIAAHVDLAGDRDVAPRLDIQPAPSAATAHIDHRCSLRLRHEIERCRERHTTTHPFAAEAFCRQRNALVKTDAAVGRDVDLTPVPVRSRALDDDVSGQPHVAQQGFHRERAPFPAGCGVSRAAIQRNGARNRGTAARRDRHRGAAPSRTRSTAGDPSQQNRA